MARRGSSAVLINFVMVLASNSRLPFANSRACWLLRFSVAEGRAKDLPNFQQVDLICVLKHTTNNCDSTVKGVYTQGHHGQIALAWQVSAGTAGNRRGGGRTRASPSPQSA